MSIWNAPPGHHVMFQNLDEDGYEVVPGIFVHVHTWDSDVEFHGGHKHALLGCKCGAGKHFDNPEAGAQG